MVSVQAISCVILAASNGAPPSRLERGVKLSLVSATSIFALAAASGVPANGYVLIPAQSETNIYDLVHDGDTTVSAADPSVLVVAALQATEIDRQEASFTGPIDRSAAAGTAFPLVPLGAAPGTPPDDDFAMQFTGAWHWNTWQKALAIGVARIAPLIGTIGNGASTDEKPGSTVFVAESSQSGFNNSSASGNRRRPAAANGFAPSSTSTATITITEPANRRQLAGSGFAVAVPTNAQPRSEASEPAPADAEPPTPSYQYAPQPSPGARSNLVTASFGSGITASRAATLVYQPVISANGQPGIGPGRPNSLPASDAASIFAARIDVTLPIDGQANPTRGDGTQALLPASVSADPATTVARYVTSVLDATPGSPSGQTIEAFQIGPTKGAHTSDGVTTSVADPLQGKIMAGVGPLDNSLALP